MSPVNNEAVIESAIEIFNSLQRRHGKYYRQPRSIVEMYLVCLYAVGEKEIDYETISTVTGHGITFSYHREKFWAGWVFIPGELERLAKLSGYSFNRSFEVDTVEKAWDFIKKGVDSGSAVQAEHFEHMVYAGYKDADRINERQVLAMCRPFANPPKWWTWEEFSQSRNVDGDKSMAYIDGKSPKAANNELVKEVLDNIVKWSAGDPRANKDFLKDIKWGLEAMRAFRDDVTNLNLKKNDFASGWLACHALTPQWSARRATAKWLEKICDESSLTKETIANLNNSKEQYMQAYDTWRQFDRIGQAKQSWDSENQRKKMAELIDQAIKLEENAVALVKKALNCWR